MQRIMLEEARAEVAEALTAAEKRRQPPRLLRLQQSQRPGGRRLASLEFCAEAAPASGGFALLLGTVHALRTFSICSVVGFSFAPSGGPDYDVSRLRA